MDAYLQELNNNKKKWWGITTAKSKFFNHPATGYQPNRNTNNNFRLNGQSGSYNFTFGKRQNGFGYGNPVTLSGKNSWIQQPATTSDSIFFFKFQNCFYQQPRNQVFFSVIKTDFTNSRNQPYGNQPFRPQQPPVPIGTTVNIPTNRNVTSLFQPQPLRQK